MKIRIEYAGALRIALAAAAALTVALIAAGWAGNAWTPSRLQPIEPTPDLTRPAPVDNGYREFLPTATATPTVATDGGWTSFVWYGQGLVFNAEGPITFDTETAATLRITDDFCAGDRFRVYDHGIELEAGATFNVHDAIPGGALGPDRAFREDWLSSGIYHLEPGAHSILVQVVENPWGMGRAYLRVDTEYPFETFDLETVSSTYAHVHGQDRFRFAARMAPSIRSDGVWPESEEITLWYGRYLEVLPASALACAWNDDGRYECSYEGDGPGIRSVRIVDDLVIISGNLVDLCPGGNPHRISMWIGNDGTSLPVRCEGTLRSDAP